MTNGSNFANVNANGNANNNNASNSNGVRPDFGRYRNKYQISPQDRQGIKRKEELSLPQG